MRLKEKKDIASWTNNLTIKEKKALCRQWQASGLKLSRFCKEQRIPISTLYGWYKKHILKKDTKMDPSFSPLSSKSNNESAKEDERVNLELRLDNSISLHLNLPIVTTAKLIKELCYAVTIVR